MNQWTISVTGGSIVLTNATTSGSITGLKTQFMLQQLSDVQFKLINLYSNNDTILDRTEFVSPSPNSSMELFLDSVAALIV